MRSKPWLMFLILVSSILGCNGYPRLFTPATPTPPPGFLNVNTVIPNRLFLNQTVISADNKLLAALGGTEPEAVINQLFVVNLDTRQVVYSGTEGQWRSLAFSPDGRQIAACGYDSPREGIFLFDLGSSTTTYLGEGCWPAWSPDEQNIAFVHFAANHAGQGRRAQIHVLNLITGVDTVILDTPSSNGFIVHLKWSPLGERLTFVMDVEVTDVAGRPNYDEDLYVMNVDGSGFRMLTDRSQEAVYPSFSPDGKRILYLDQSNPRIGRSMHVTDLDGECHRLNSPLPGITIRSVALSPNGEKIAFNTQYGLLLADARLALGDDFWTTGTPCSP